MTEEKKCPFCTGPDERLIVAENKHAIVFENLKPAIPIHFLVIPKKHYEDIPEMPEEIIADMLMLLRIITNAYQLQVKKEEINGFLGYDFSWPFGAVAGRTIPHFHLHIFGRHENDGVNSLHSEANLKIKGCAITMMQSKSGDKISDMPLDIFHKFFRDMAIVGEHKVEYTFPTKILATGYNVVMNQGYHTPNHEHGKLVHGHVIPRIEGDGVLKLRTPNMRVIPEEEAFQIASKLRSYI